MSAGRRKRTEGEMVVTDERLPVRVGLSLMDKPMTRSQAQRYGERNMPPELKRIGWQVVVFRSDAEIHGSNFFRVNYAGK